MSRCFVKEANLAIDNNTRCKKKNTMTDLAKLRRATQLIKKLRRESSPYGGYARGKERDDFQLLVDSLNHSLPCDATVRFRPSDFHFAGANRETVVELCKCLLLRRQQKRLGNNLAPCVPLAGCTGFRATCNRQQSPYCKKCNRI